MRISDWSSDVCSSDLDSNTPILKADGSTTIADSNDFSSILKVGGKLYAVSQFESQPGAMYLTTLSQDGETGKLSATDTQAIDLSAIHGIWNPCAGSVTPWETHQIGRASCRELVGQDAYISVVAGYFKKSHNKP